jgi:hypothetical protein
MFEDFSVYDDCEPAGLELPQISLSEESLKALELTNASSSKEILSRLIRLGIETKGIDKFPNKKEYFERAKQELETFDELGFTDYILLNWDVVKFAKDSGIPVGEGRGCFLAESLIKTNNGTKNIEDISIGDIVYDYENQLQEVKDVYCYNVDEDVLELTLEDGTLISCTKDHEFYTENRGWIKAEDLCEDDNLRVIHGEASPSL